jgi:hypothetical protein
MQRRIPPRRLVAIAFAAILAVESVGAVAASIPGQPAVPQVAPAAAPARAVDVRPDTPSPAPSATPGPVLGPVFVPVPSPSVDPTPSPSPKATPKPKAENKPKATPKPKAQSKPKATPKPKAQSKPKASSAPRTSTFKGTNHVWIPALGINKSVKAFPCSRTRPPDNYMYRWGCAGANNVYLMGHAYSVMKGLHDAYTSGRLRAGMKAYYAGSNGKVHTYVVKWWKKVLPTPDAAWAWAAQSVPSMTLQTCVGKNSEYRLMVRLVEVRG